MVALFHPLFGLAVLGCALILVLVRRRHQRQLTTPGPRPDFGSGALGLFIVAVLALAGFLQRYSASTSMPSTVGVQNEREAKSPAPGQDGTILATLTLPSSRHSDYFEFHRPGFLSDQSPVKIAHGEVLTLRGSPPRKLCVVLREGSTRGDPEIRR